MINGCYKTVVFTLDKLYKDRKQLNIYKLLIEYQHDIFVNILVIAFNYEYYEFINNFLTELYYHFERLNKLEVFTFILFTIFELNEDLRFYKIVKRFQNGEEKIKIESSVIPNEERIFSSSTKLINPIAIYFNENPISK